MAGKPTESTTKFKADISDLVNGMQTAKRQIALANAEFKAASAGMDKWSDSADGVSAKLTSLEKVLGSQKTILSNLENQYKLTADQMGADSKEAENLRIKIENQKATIATTEKQIRNYSTSLDELKASADGVDGEITDAADAFDDMADSAKDAVNGSKEADDGFTTTKGVLADLVANGIMAAASAFLDLAEDSQSAGNAFAAATGTASENMDEYNDAIENIYKNNFGESLNDVADAMAKVKQQTGEVDPTKLQELTENALTLSDTFDMDVTESMRAVTQLQDQFGISGEEAFNLISQGAQNGLNKNDNLLDTINEYGPKFEQMGLSADDMFNMLQSGADAGVFDIDKLGDAVNEFSIRAKDGTADLGFEQLGLDVDATKKAFGEGGDAAKTALQETMNALNAVEDPLEKNQIGVQLFGTMWEDTGGDAIAAMGDMSGSMDSTKSSMEDLKNVKYDDVMSQLQGLGRTLVTDILTPLVEKIIPPVEKFVTWLTDNIPLVSSIVIGLGAAMATLSVANMIMGVVKSFQAFKKAQEGATVAQWLMNAAMNANPIGIIIALIVGLVAAFVVLWNKSEAFRNFWIKLWDNVKKITSDVVSAIGKFFSDLWDGIKETWSTVSKWFNEKVIQPIAKFFKNLWTGLKDGAKAAWTFIKNVFTVVSSWFNNTLIKPVTKFFSGMWNGLKDGASKAWSGIKSIFSKVGSFFSETFSKAWSKVKDIFSAGGKIFSGIKEGIGDAFKKIVNTLIKGINKIVSVPFNAINKMLNKIRNTSFLNISPFKKLWGENPVAVPKIPQLYEGGVLRKGQTGYLEGNGDEAVVPLEKNTGWLDEVANKIVSKGGISGNGSTTSNNTSNTYNFNQVNNSPKSLSRLEIYRQTKNQLNFAKGV